MQVYPSYCLCELFI